MTPQTVPLHSESAGYREWEIVLDGQRYCIIHEVGTWFAIDCRLPNNYGQHYCIIHEVGEGWTLLRESVNGEWHDDGRTVDEFLTAYDLRLEE